MAYTHISYNMLHTTKQSISHIGCLVVCITMLKYTKKKR